MSAENNNRQRVDPYSTASRLCSSCGLCCSGVLFGSVQLKAGDSPELLRSLGFQLLPAAGADAFILPCPKHDGAKCTVYCSRPIKCREFECKLLQEVVSSKIQLDTALSLIEKAKEKAETLRRLLHDAGQTNETLPLSRRYQEAIEASLSVNSDQNQHSGRLMAAAYRLTQELKESFYTESDAI